MQKTYSILVPENLDLEARLKQFPPDFKYNIDFFYLIIHFVIKNLAYKIDKNKEITTEKLFIGLSSTTLQSFCRNYNEHIDYLIENFSGAGRILWRRPYTKGHSFSYKLSPFYANKKLKIYTITDQNLMKKIKPKFALKIQPSVRKHYSFLTSYLDPKKITVQLSDALNHNERLYLENSDYQKYLLNASKILKMNNGEFYMTHKPETDGRIHTSLSGFPKEFRKFLRYENSVLAEIDISASVPTFLFFILSNLTNNNCHLNSIINSTKTYYNHYMLVKKRVALCSKELEQFQIQIGEGTLYERFVDGFHTIHLFDERLKPDEYLLSAVEKKFNRKFDGDMDDLIKVVKTNMLSMLNAKPNTFVNEKAVFQSYFPKMHFFITELKKKNHRFYSYLTLQTESYFMLNIVARQLNKDFRKKIPLLTLHDCIVTTEDKASIVKTFMETTFLKELGFVPMLKSKTWV
ncbi:hypothetical protein QO200_18700 [Flavobacterium sp. Arc3]|uniref:hypothetical protein n=1 Tax=Flavobacterium sp. Arc3 TaxID=3046686 RepID=UPI00352C8FD7